MPVALAPDEPESTELGVIAEPAAPVPGAAAVTVSVAFATTVSVADGQALFAALLLVSPP